MVPLYGGWRSDSDLPHRKNFLLQIIACLDGQKPEAQSDWREQVPQMARQLEDMLYRFATSLDEYNDITTLVKRLQNAIWILGEEAWLAKQNGVAARQEQAQRLEKYGGVDRVMELLEHAASCTLQPCTNSDCRRMKELFSHINECEIKAQNGCIICKRVWAALQGHARRCTRDVCPVPKCGILRDRIRQQETQKQQK